jgi:hypothetical protein
LASAAAYFGSAGALLRDLPMPEAAAPRFELTRVPLPDWAADLGTGDDRALVVEAACVLDGSGPAHERCDWVRAAVLHLTGWLEVAHERRHGPIHSYFIRLPSAWAEAYDFAWVNRICLFLRRLVARRLGADEEVLFGPLPKPRILLTHDVDAVDKTLALRLKKLAFSGFNALRQLSKGQGREALARLAEGFRFALHGADFRLFDALCALERRHGRTSLFLFHGRESRVVSPGRWLLDPGYRISAAEFPSLLHDLVAQGWEVGVHPSFYTWRDAGALARECRAVGAASGRAVTACRQHWLRFSWAETWREQVKAGITLDTTLGFNDRPGFRNGCALRFQPWDVAAGRPLGLAAVPMVLMDSHLYDYTFMDDAGRRATIARWLGEVAAVGGEASIIWHVHVMHPTYGWAAGYEELLAQLDTLAPVSP